MLRAVLHWSGRFVIILSLRWAWEHSYSQSVPSVCQADGAVIDGRSACMIDHDDPPIQPASP